MRQAAAANAHKEALLRSSIVLRQCAQRVKRARARRRWQNSADGKAARHPETAAANFVRRDQSEQVGHHFASPGNPFWRLMYASRLLPVELTSDDDARLLEFDLALTSLCPRATRSAAE